MPTKIGKEFLVNTYTTGNQTDPAITSLTNGNFVVTWQSINQDGSGDEVYGQLFNATGAKLGNEFLVNSYTVGNQQYPSIASLKYGYFAISWQSHDRGDSSDGIYGQMFTPEGIKSDREFLVNTYTTDQHDAPSITSLTNGNFLVTWQSYNQDGSGYGIYGRVLPTFHMQSDEFLINTYTLGDQKYPSATGLTFPSFVVTWQSQDQPDADCGIYGQIFASAGVKVGSELSINTRISGDQQAPSVTSLKNGNFVVTWQNNNQANSSYGIYGQIFTLDGVKSGSEFLINTYTMVKQQAPSITSLTDSHFVATWQDGNQDGSGYGVYGQVFTAVGEKLDSEFLVNTYTTGDQKSPAITTLKNGNFVVTWQSNYQDGSNYGIYGQVFYPFREPARIGSEFLVSLNTRNQQTGSVAISLTNGNFVTAWRSSIANSPDNGFYGQLFTTSGVRTGREFLIKLSDTATAISMASLTNGNFVATWLDTQKDEYGQLSVNICGQIFTSAGIKSGNELLVNTYGNKEAPSVTGLKNGNFVVTWAHDTYSNSGYDVYGQIFTAAGEQSGSAFPVYYPMDYDQKAPSVTTLTNGNFVLTWQSNNQDRSKYGIYGQIFTAVGEKIGYDFLVNTYTTGNQEAASITSLTNGNFVVTWQSYLQDGSDYGIYGQIFTAEGVKSGSEFLVNTVTGNYQRNPFITGLTNGCFVVTWEGGYNGTPNSFIYGQIFDAEGIKAGSEFLVNNSTGTYVQGPSMVTLANGNFFATWYTSNTTNIYDKSVVYGQIFQPFPDESVSASSSSSAIPSLLPVTTTIASSTFSSIPVLFSPSSETSTLLPATTTVVSSTFSDTPILLSSSSTTPSLLPAMTTTASSLFSNTLALPSSSLTMPSSLPAATSSTFPSESSKNTLTTSSAALLVSSTLAAVSSTAESSTLTNDSNSSSIGIIAAVITSLLGLVGIALLAWYYRRHHPKAEGFIRINQSDELPMDTVNGFSSSSLLDTEANPPTLEGLSNQSNAPDTKISKNGLSELLPEYPADVKLIP